MKRDRSGISLQPQGKSPFRKCRFLLHILNIYTIKTFQWFTFPEIQIYPNGMVRHI